MKAGYKMYRPLMPGPWFKTVGPAEYLLLYGEILGALDPEKVARDLSALGGGRTPVMCCYESIAKIQTGEQWCHRSIAARWLTDRLGIEVEELGAPPGFNPWVRLQQHGLTPPSFQMAAA
jgi:hypothetical protein